MQDLVSLIVATIRTDSNIGVHVCMILFSQRDSLKLAQKTTCVSNSSNIMYIIYHISNQVSATLVLPPLENDGRILTGTGRHPTPLHLLIDEPRRLTKHQISEWMDQRQKICKAPVIALHCADFRTRCRKQHLI